MLVCRNGRRGRLKIFCGRPRAGSSPATSTENLHFFGGFLCLTGLLLRINMQGKLYAVGVGPGDPELLTLRAVKTIKNADCIACPEKDGDPGLAYRIAEQAVPEISKKEIILLNFPMRKEELEDAHNAAAEVLISQLSKGKDIAFLTLGDPELYSTFYYVAGLVGARGYEIEIISGITSFSAAAAKLRLPICLGDEPVTITSGEYTNCNGTLIILKAGKKLKEFKTKIEADGKKAYMVENYGLPDEKIYDNLDSIPDEAGYFTVLIVK